MSGELSVRVVPSIGDIPAEAWNACANPGGAAPVRGNGAAAVANRAYKGPEATAFNPFLSHEFLHALEASGSATARTGWQPQHLVAEAADGAVLGVAPCYLKSHSRGEYVFDHGWADAYERAGGNYYQIGRAHV